VALAGGSAAALESRLRAGRTPIVGRIADDRVLLDLRGVPPALDAEFAALVAEALT
jgi:seryl-tRNA(Sec) selenium transferase